MCLYICWCFCGCFCASCVLFLSKFIFFFFVGGLTIYTYALCTYISQNKGKKIKCIKNKGRIIKHIGWRAFCRMHILYTYMNMCRGVVMVWVLGCSWVCVSGGWFVRKVFLGYHWQRRGVCVCVIDFQYALHFFTQKYLIGKCVYFWCARFGRRGLEETESKVKEYACRTEVSGYYADRAPKTGSSIYPKQIW